MDQQNQQREPHLSTLENKIKGTILGSALGDTIGLYTEFLSKEGSRKAYPDRKFQLVDPATEFFSDGHRNKFEKKSWTDDTDHALLIVLSYLHHNGDLRPDDFAVRLRSWIEQGLRCLDRLPLGIGKTIGRVVLDKRFLASPSTVAYEIWESTNRGIAPNGSLMRTHPLGVICLNEPSLFSTFEIAAKFSIITHTDPRCVVSCCAVTGLIRGILRNEVITEEDVDSVLNEAFEWVNQWIKSGREFSDSQIQAQDVADGEDEQKGEQPLSHREFTHHTQAENFAALSLDSPMEIGYVYKALGSSIFCLRLGIRQSPRGTSPSQVLFENIITDLIMEGGDADTNACTAAALLGCWVGYDFIPPNWRDGMDHREWLLAKCDGMVETMGVGSSSGSCADRYKGSEDPDTRPDGGKGFLTKAELEAREKEFVTRYMKMYEEKLKREKKQADKGWLSRLIGR